MSVVMNVPLGEKPKRGDLLQSNVGDRRERTWLILHVRQIIQRPSEYVPLGQLKPRFEVWRARWWELEPDFRMRLYRSAERNGGQVLWLPEKTVNEHEDLRKKT